MHLRQLFRWSKGETPACELSVMAEIYNLAEFSVTIAAKELTENAVQRFIVSHHSRYQNS